MTGEFSDLTKTQHQATFVSGYADGYLATLRQYRFLRSTTLKQMGSRKFQKEYKKLFNLSPWDSYNLEKDQ